MNLCIHIGRLSRDPEVRYGQSSNAMASFSLAVDRKFKREGQATADFLNFKAFGRTAEFIEKYCHKGTKLVVQSHLQNDNFTNKEVVKVYRDTLIVDSVEFAESKAASEKASKSEQSPASPTSDGFMNIPDAIDEEVPFR
jgi:single-strand DNA-binding protein